MLHFIQLLLYLCGNYPEKIYLQFKISKLNMKNFKFYYFCAFVVLGLVITSCGDDDEHGENTVTITINAPLNGAVISECSNVSIQVDFVATDENHETEIILHPVEDASDKIIDYDGHDHDKEFTFTQDIDLCSYVAGTCFRLAVDACVDHDCEEKVAAEAEFCLQQ